MKKKWILLFLSGLLFLLVSCAGLTDRQEPGSTTETNERTEGTVKYDCDAVFFGDSITCDGNFDALLPGRKIVNLGVYGDTIEDLRRRVPDVGEKRPARIFLLGGINSLTSPDNVKECLEQYAGLLDALRRACPEAKLIVQSVLPVGAKADWAGDLNDAVRAFNEGIRQLAQQRGLAFVDLYAVYEKNGVLDPALTRDGVHLNYTAYGPWVAALAPCFSAD